MLAIAEEARAIEQGRMDRGEQPAEARRRTPSRISSATGTGPTAARPPATRPARSASTNTGRRSTASTTPGATGTWSAPARRSRAIWRRPSRAARPPRRAAGRGRSAPAAAVPGDRRRPFGAAAMSGGGDRAARAQVSASRRRRTRPLRQRADRCASCASTCGSCGIVGTGRRLGRVVLRRVGDEPHSSDGLGDGVRFGEEAAVASVFAATHGAACRRPEIMPNSERAVPALG